MGTISEKLGRQLNEAKAGRRATPVSDLRRLARRVQRKLGPARSPRGFQDYHPSHAAYLAAQNLVSYLAEEMSALREMWEYSAIVGPAEDEYMPDGPPFSPLTKTYFTTWAFFDASFGQGRETIGTCLLDIGPDLGISPDYLAAIRFMQQSRMGIYEHRGVEGEHVRLRELISGQSYTCLVPAGYLGQAGELWYARILPPPFADLDDSLVFTTPYHLIAPGKKAWTDFLNRTMAKTGLPISQSAKTGSANEYPALEALMKYGLHRNYWHEFIFQAYVNYRHDVVLLAGLPDVPESLPHAPQSD
jgi:hypothetical protein